MPNEEDFVPRDKYEQAVARARKAEAALAGQQRALAAGVPAELAGDSRGRP